jgi:predicted nucleotidyltransferase
METRETVLLKILKDYSILHTVTSIAKETNLSRVGAWKILKKLEKERLIDLKPIGTGKTSAYVLKINWNNPLTEKNLELMLAKEAQNRQRWVEEFKETYSCSYVVILFGSILKKEKDANDIDLFIVLDRAKNEKLNEIITKKNAVLIKKIHSIKQTRDDLINNLRKKDPVMMSIMKEGIVLHGQGLLIDLIKNVTN